MTRATRTLTLVLTIAAASAILSYRPVYEPDLGWHLAHGRENLAGRLVRTNLFSFTWPEYPQRYTSWLSETIAYAAWSAGGDAAVRTLQAAALAVTFGFVYLACRVRGAVLPSVAILVFGFLVIEPRAIPRPHLVSFAGVAVCSWLIERARAARFRTTADCGRAARRHLEQPARGIHVRSPDDRSLRRCAARSPVLALTARVDACPCGSDGLCRRPARESVRMGIDPVPVRERLRAAAAGDRRAAAGVPAVLQGVLRLRRAGGAAARVHAAPADRVGRPRCTRLRGPRLPLPEVHAARVPRHGADARGASHGVERARPRQPCRPRHRARWRPLRVASAALRVRDFAAAPAASFPKRCCRRARSTLRAPKASPAPSSTATISAGG